MTLKPARRATSLAEMYERIDHLQSPEGEAVAHAFTPRPDDVLIATFPKCGTTWMQQIVHGLRTGGSMDFSEISNVVPWIEMSHVIGVDLNAEQPGNCRIFKSHNNWYDIQRGGRYIVIFRNYKDVAVSLYRFFEGWFFDPGSVTFEELTASRFLEGPRQAAYWDFILSWWPRRQDADTLLLFYEDMIDDLPATVRQVIDFIGMDVSPEVEAIAIEQAGLPFMQAHKGQFDDHHLRDDRAEACGLPLGGSSDKVRTGKVGGHNELMSAAFERQLDEAWRDQITNKLGFESYEAFRAANRQN